MAKGGSASAHLSLLGPVPGATRKPQLHPEPSPVGTQSRCGTEAAEVGAGTSRVWGTVRPQGSRQMPWHQGPADESTSLLRWTPPGGLCPWLQGSEHQDGFPSAAARGWLGQLSSSGLASWAPESPWGAQRWCPS